MLRLRVLKVLVHVLVDVGDHTLVDRVLIPLQGENEIRFCFNNLLGNGFLSPHGVDRNDCALDVHQPQ